MCDSSCASTPSSSTRFIFSSRPVVTASAGVLRVAAGGERVRRGIVDDVEPRLREPGRDAEALDEVVVAGGTRARRPAWPGWRRARSVSRVEVRAPRHRDRDDDDDRRCRHRSRRTQEVVDRARRPAAMSDDEDEQDQERRALVRARSARTRGAPPAERRCGAGAMRDRASARTLRTATWHRSRASGSASKYSRFLKLNMPAMRFAGTSGSCCCTQSTLSL